MLVAGPGIDGHLDDLLVHVHKPGFDVPPLQFVRNSQTAIRLLRGIIHSIRPVLERPVIRHRPIVTKRRVHEILALHPPARFRVFEALLNNFAKVREAAHHKACVYIVVVIFGDGPIFLLSIVDHELHVGGDVRGLDGGEICAFDGGIWVGVPHFDRPVAGAGADVQDVARSEERGIV